MLRGYRIEATRTEDLPDVERFLTDGFGSSDPLAFTERVLRWKYFEPCGVDFGPRSWVARADGDIVGHAGIAPRQLVVRTRTAESPPVVTAHFMDVLASPSHTGAGLALMKRGFRDSTLQLALGGSEDGRRMWSATGYECRSEFPMMRSVLRPAHRLRAADFGPIGRLARVGVDAARTLRHPRRRPRRTLSLRRVDRFGPEIDDLSEAGPVPLACTIRSAAVLNYYLGHPAGTMSGFVLEDGSHLAGFALLNVVREGDIRSGRIVDCFLGSTDEDLWHAAFAALRSELKEQGADLARAYASTEWHERPLAQAGFFRHPPLQQFYVRDKERLLPAEVPVHLTPLEADQGYQV